MTHLVQTPNQPSDERLAHDAQAGSIDCFEELVRRYQLPLLRFLLARLPGRSDAEDVLQETFVRVWQHLADYRDAWPFRTWIFTIARRQAIDHLRRRDPSPIEADPVIADPKSPADDLAREECKARLWQIVREALNEEQYTAVWLFYVEQMSAGQIARVIDRSWSAVKAMLSRARKRLAPHLRRWAGPDGEGSLLQDLQPAAPLRTGEP